MRSFLVVFYSCFFLAGVNGTTAAERCQSDALRGINAYFTENAKVLQIIQNLQVKVGSDSTIRVCETQRAIIPATIMQSCWVIIPSDLIEMASDEAMLGLIAHEASHCIIWKRSGRYHTEYEADIEAALLVGSEAVIKGLLAVEEYQAQHLRRQIEPRIRVLQALR